MGSLLALTVRSEGFQASKFLNRAWVALPLRITRDPQRSAQRKMARVFFRCHRGGLFYLPRTIFTTKMAASF